LLFQADDSGRDAFDVAFDFQGRLITVPTDKGFVHCGVALLVIELYKNLYVV
jgi:hypothetical protein